MGTWVGPWGEIMARRKWATAGIAALTLAAWGIWPTVGFTAGEVEVGLPLPRFASLHSDKVNLRTGPGERYPIAWVYIRKDWPVEIIGQLDHWRHVRDSEGTEGWVQEKLVVIGKREVVVAGAVRALRQSPDLGAALVARAEPGVMARLVECRGAWCRIEAGEIIGWVQRSDIWGVYPNEAVP